MFEGLHEIDWAAMRHAYGSAEEVPDLLVDLASPDAATREQALGDYYGAVHHQGDIYPCTAASLPFLFGLAADPATPDRHVIVTLLVDIGRAAVGRRVVRADDEVELAVIEAAEAIRARAELFAALAEDADPRLRTAATAALGLFLDDAGRALLLLRRRFEAGTGFDERREVLEAAVALAHREPGAVGAVVDWCDAVLADPVVDPSVRLAALASRAEAAPGRLGEGFAAEAAALLEAIAGGAGPSRADELAKVPPRFAPVRRSPQLEGYTPVTRLTARLHEAAGGRTEARAAILAVQLRSPDRGLRLDGVRQTAEFARGWRGDHGPLLARVGGELDAGSGGLLAHAAALALHRVHPLAGIVREPLAAFVTAQVEAHGPEVWHHEDPFVREAHRDAVQTLARLGDPRAAPVLAALLDRAFGLPAPPGAAEAAVGGDGGDLGLLLRTAGRLGGAADVFAPRLLDHLRRFGTDAPHVIVAAAAVPLAAFGHAPAVPLLAEILAAAAAREDRMTASSALIALCRFGPLARPALAAVAPLAADAKPWIAQQSLAALWAITGEADLVMPALIGLLDGEDRFATISAAEVLARIGPAAEEASTLLRGLLHHDYEWVRVQAAEALWAIHGEPAAETVLGVLLPAWERHPATANDVADCLDRMGAAAGPALPQVRAALADRRRGGRFDDLESDIALQRTCRSILENCS